MIQGYATGGDELSARYVQKVERFEQKVRRLINMAEQTTMMEVPTERSLAYMTDDDIRLLRTRLAAFDHLAAAEQARRGERPAGQDDEGEA